jgi:peptide-methionine (S)-S-oxide reductase
MGTKIETATLAGGCFWCLEAVFDDLEGVISVESGYSGGHVANPSYQEVCMGTTGHAEVVQIQFDPTILSYHDLLTIFFSIHDPTTLDRQGDDVGEQYRSAIFYHDDEQKETAGKVMTELAAMKLWEAPIVTELTTYDVFYRAESYHQEYFANNPNQPYCRLTVAPKVAKFRKEFAARLKAGKGEKA